MNAEKNGSEKTPLGIYLHIPFCVRKCNYCDFLSAPADEDTKKRYVSRLIQEIREFENAGDFQVQSVFFGGGTPSILDGEDLAEVMKALRESFCFCGTETAESQRSVDRQCDASGQERRYGRQSDAQKQHAGQGMIAGEHGETEAAGSGGTGGSRFPEVTVECNPGTLTPEKLRIYREAGINRLSIGLQSTDNRELKLLGRIHTWETFQENYEAARKAGFSNINIDLMSALPGQTTQSWRKTLEQVLALRPEHISAYSLIIEEGTPFYEQYGWEEYLREKGEECTKLPSEEVEREMYYDTKQMLEKAGLLRYEISNYARPGYESRHNSGYWTRKNYAGFGLGASSLIHSLRYKNTEVLTDYLGGDFSKREVLVLSKDNQIEETMYLGLRMMCGIDKQKFLDTFQVPAEVVYRRELEKLKKKGLITEDRESIRLTELGIDVSNQVLAEFLLTD